MRKVMLLILALLTVAGAIGTSIPAVEAAGGGGSSNCNWTCTCTGAAVCQCAPGTTGFCSYPPIGCAQVITC